MAAALVRAQQRRPQQIRNTRGSRVHGQIAGGLLFGEAGGQGVNGAEQRRVVLPLQTVAPAQLGLGVQQPGSVSALLGVAPGWAGARRRCLPSAGARLGACGGESSSSTAPTAAAKAWHKAAAEAAKAPKANGKKNH